LGFSNEIQVFSGIAAVCGHNWSIFLRLAGGRGIGTLIGAFSVIAPKILGFAIIPFVLLGLIWNLSIGTLLFFPTAILLSVYLNQFESAGIFSVLALFPVLIKRLSPIGEIFQPDKKPNLIRNRLLFDDDKPRFDLRIKRIFRKFKSGRGVDT